MIRNLPRHAMQHGSWTAWQPDSKAAAGQQRSRKGAQPDRRQPDSMAAGRRKAKLGSVRVARRERRAEAWARCGHVSKMPLPATCHPTAIAAQQTHARTHSASELGATCGPCPNTSPRATPNLQHQPQLSWRLLLKGWHTSSRALARRRPTGRVLGRGFAATGGVGTAAALAAAGVAGASCRTAAAG